MAVRRRVSHPAYGGARAEFTTGVARVDRRTKDLVKRLQPGDIAVIDHEDLDRVAAEGLIECRVAGVINASRSISGRYPNVGPLLIAAAGIPLVDGVGRELLDAVTEGQVLGMEGDDVFAGPVLLGSGSRQTLQSLEAAYEAAKSAMGDELERFAENTLEFMRRERGFFLDAEQLPKVRTDVSGRHVLIVVRGHDYKEDLAALRGYVREMRPVLIGVDGGADALLDAGHRPDVVIGDFDSVSSSALHSGAELIVHGYPGGEAPGAARLQRLGLAFEVFEAGGTSEDIAMLLAYEKGAALIVAVGTHASMVEFLDKGRAGMASTFLTRLRVGPLLVDAKGVSRLYHGRIRRSDMTVFLLAVAAFFVVIAVFVTPPVFREGLWFIVRDLWDSAFR
ncbi:MAG: FIG005773: conserved membrane protein ML1361 [uncultured Acidimicrobiales bacterium]|uniref:FIG005773: conserved membrane protein ML1361 n=1 Tax=uncultured Acidimicrobiales bacterium TaxID=310071 RepID=A0A6J4HDA6_9ACTN|nr:MAG: FIG005773: conserved membrane protein ML1361 [uncultured Acidimicrobiales bacterium]